MRETLIPYGGCNSTPNEPWTMDRKHYPSHWYVQQADFALKRLKTGRCLVVGSPIFEAMELISSGLIVTYFDVRDPKVEGLPFVQGDATKMQFADESFDCASSTCVLCHAGLGRYGDAQVEDGDELMLSEISRVLKKGGKLAVTFGPVSTHWTVARLENCQRVYSLDEATRMAIASGFVVTEVDVLDTRDAVWIHNVSEDERVDRFYLSMLMEKK